MTPDHPSPSPLRGLVWLADGVSVEDLDWVRDLSPLVACDPAGLRGPIRLGDGSSVDVTPLAAARPADVLFVPPATGWSTLLRDLEGLLFLHRLRRHYARVVAWDNGILVVAACGLANGRRVAGDAQRLPGLQHAPRVLATGEDLADDPPLLTATGPEGVAQMRKMARAELTGDQPLA